MGRSQEREEPAGARVRLRVRDADLFDEPTLERTDSRRDYGERRTIAVGLAQGVLLTVVYTDRVGGGGEVVRRIISARKSDRRERTAYQETVQP